MVSLNETHDPSRRSWVQSANAPDCDFPIQNLPFGVFKRQGSKVPPRVGVAIGNQILNLATVGGLLHGEARGVAEAAAASSINDIMFHSPDELSALRLQLSKLLSKENAKNRAQVEKHFTPLDQVELLAPVKVREFTDFYASVFHATNVGRVFRPGNPLLPNYKWLPVGYHGRASSIRCNKDVVRPRGQIKPEGADAPVYAPSRHLDYETELGVVIRDHSLMGKPVPVARAGEHIFGLCLLNDWSARDMQAWESQPLGPFLSKTFATTISPWIVTVDALAPFRTNAFARAAEDPKPLPHLFAAEDQESGGLDIQVETLLLTEKMRAAQAGPYRLSRSTSASLYWTVAQMIAHHTSNGCNLQNGDLIGTGTVSGEDRSSWGSLLELTRRGDEKLTLPNGEMRGFLEDGDEIIMRGECRREGFVRIGFGECRAKVLPASGE